MEPLFISTLLVAVAEIGDKTQLLALVLATRFRAPWQILAGITLATLANHALAALVGQMAAELVSEQMLRWMLVASFLGMAAWVLVPDRLDDGEKVKKSRAGPFLAATLTFFLVEMGDKTQIATVALGARYEALELVILGTTLGMLAANAPVVVMGHLLADRLPLKTIRAIAALLFLLLGLWMALFGL